MMNHKSDQQLQESPYFDISEFQGLTKFKIIIPLLYIASWICMFAGPSLFQVQYQIFTLIVLGYLLYKILGMLITMLFITYKTTQILQRAENQQDQDRYYGLSQITNQIYHTIIIPNYKEQVELLAETLQVLASHKRAKGNYLIVLAMEAHQADSDKKAYQLIHSFQQYFRAISYTRHPLRKYQQKGKASNVSWCAQNLKPIFQKYMINPDSVMLTIIDADSWAPDLYFDVLQDTIMEQYEQRHERMYQPTQIFTRNNMEVPVLARVHDNLIAFLHTSSLLSCSDLTFPLSNYTISYKLAEYIGFWDTCSEAIAEDMHTMQKAYWKTDGQMKGRPIYVPFNQANLSTGNGYWQDIKARFWQSERHARAVAEISYLFKQLLRAPFRLKNLHITILIFQLFAFVAIGPWVICSLAFQKFINIYYKPSPQMLSLQFMTTSLTIINLIGGLNYVLFEYCKRRANSKIYKQQNESILRILQYFVFVGPVFVLVFIPTFIIAGFKTLFGEDQYIVAQKKMGKRRQIS